MVVESIGRSFDDLPGATELDGGVRRRLLERWQEPHRKYHGVAHLQYGLQVLDELGGQRLERIAYWCHDIVHTNTSPRDEYASVDLTEELLWGRISDVELDEVTRLILITIKHAPAAGDDAGARISDADLAGLALDWDAYLENVAGIRAELPHLSEAQWRSRRQRQLSGLLERDRIFHTAHGYSAWEDRARVNMLRELGAMR